MGEMFKTAAALAQQKKDEELLKENYRLQLESDEENAYIARENAREEKIKKRQAVFEAKANIKKGLLTEGLKSIFIRSMKKPTSEEKAVCESLIGNYVEEQGAENLLVGFKGKTSFLESFHGLIQKHYTRILTEAEENGEDPENMGITQHNVEEFLDDLDKTEDMEDVTNTIRLRVANAEEEFVNRVEQDKQNLHTILKDTSERVQNTRPTLDNDYGDEDPESPDEGPQLPEDNAVDPEAQQEAVRIAKRQIMELQERSMNIFGKMVQNITKASVVNVGLREQFGTDNGRVDIDKIVDSARCMYTMLEMVSTLKIENVDAKYVQDTLNSIM